MALAALTNVPSDKDELDMWGFCHMAHHRDINQRVFELLNVHLDEYILDPLNPNNPGGWGNQHQAMHNQVNLILGTSGFDLTQPDWKDPSNLAGWVQSNSLEHRQWADLLGVG